MIKRNVLMSDLFPEDETLKSLGFECDSVLYKKPMIGSMKPFMAFEFDGGEHYEDIEVSRRDRRKEQMLSGHGIQLIRLPNSFSKDYEYICQLIKQYAKEPITEDEQLSLF